MKRREHRFAEKSRLEKAELDLELEANPQPLGSREGTKSRKAKALNKYTSKSQHSIPQPLIPAKQIEGASESVMSSTATLPPHIVEVVTIDSSSESEEESEFIRVLRKFGSFY